MARKKQNAKSAAQPDPATSQPRAGNIERLINALLADLPAVDGKNLNAALAEVEERPRTSLHYLFEHFSDPDAATRAVVGRILTARGGPEVIDNLNAVVFDAGHDDLTRVRANDLLAELGSPVDPEVFAMSVSDADDLREKLPSRAIALLDRGDVEAAVRHAGALEPADRFLLIHAAASRPEDRALPFLKSLAADGEENARAVVSAVAAQQLAAAVPLLLEIQQSAGRDLTKLIKRTFFDLRKAGIRIPDEKPRLEAAPETEADDDQLPLYRAMISDPSPNGLVLVMVARTRPTGRLKVFSVLLDFWKRGIRQAGLRVGMSRSSFERLVNSQAGTRLTLRDAPLDECRRAVARGVRVAKEFGTALPLDFGVGRPLLGDIGDEIAALDNPFLCSRCEKPLDPETIEKLRAAAAYDNIPAETSCHDCRNHKADRKKTPTDGEGV